MKSECFEYNQSSETTQSFLQSPKCEAVISKNNKTTNEDKEEVVQTM